MKSLANKRAFGLAESVVRIGSPVPFSTNNWRDEESSCREDDRCFLGERLHSCFLYLVTSIPLETVGLHEIRYMNYVEGVDNLDVSDGVHRHLGYPELTGVILKKLGFVDVRIEDVDIESDCAGKQLIDSENEGVTSQFVNTKQACG